MQLKNNKYPGPDNIGPKLIKYVACELCYCFMYLISHLRKVLFLINQSLLKLFPSLTSSYQTITDVSLINVFDKLLDKLMAVRQYGFLDVHNILYDYQFKFCKNQH